LIPAVWQTAGINPAARWRRQVGRSTAPLAARALSGSVQPQDEIAALLEPVYPVMVTVPSSFVE
jgi:hypothetical protein